MTQDEIIKKVATFSTPEEQTAYLEGAKDGSLMANELYKNAFSNETLEEWANTHGAKQNEKGEWEV